MINEREPDTENALFATLPSAQSPLQQPPYSKPEQLPTSGPTSGVVPIRGLRALLPRANSPETLSRGVIVVALVAALFVLAVAIYATILGEDDRRPVPGLDAPRF